MEDVVMDKQASRYASQPQMPVQGMGGFTPMGHSSAMFPFTMGAGFNQAAATARMNPNPAAKPAAPVATPATAQGVMQAMQKVAFGRMPEGLQALLDTVCAFAKSADVQVAGAPAAGNAPNAGARSRNMSHGNAAGAVGQQGGFNQPGQQGPGSFAILGGQKPGMNLGLGGFGAVGGMMSGAGRPGAINLGPHTASPIGMRGGLKTAGMAPTPGPASMPPAMGGGTMVPPGGQQPPPPQAAMPPGSGATPPPPMPAQAGAAPPPGGDPSQAGAAPPGDPSQGGAPPGAVDPMTGQPIMNPMATPPPPMLPAAPPRAMPPQQHMDLGQAQQQHAMTSLFQDKTQHDSMHEEMGSDLMAADTKLGCDVWSTAASLCKQAGGEDNMTGWHWKALQKEEEKNKNDWLPRVFTTDETPLTEMLASPGKNSLLTGLAGGAAGGGLGYLANQAVPTGQSDLTNALIGGGAGALLGGIGGFGHRVKQNDRVIDGLRRLPAGATLHDFNTLRGSKSAFEKLAGGVPDLERYRALMAQQAAARMQNAPTRIAPRGQGWTGEANINAMPPRKPLPRIGTAYSAEAPQPSIWQKTPTGGSIPGPNAGPPDTFPPQAPTAPVQPSTKPPAAPMPMPMMGKTGLDRNDVLTDSAGESMTMAHWAQKFARQIHKAVYKDQAEGRFKVAGEYKPLDGGIPIPKQAASQEGAAGGSRAGGIMGAVGAGGIGALLSMLAARRLKMPVGMMERSGVAAKNMMGRIGKPSVLERLSMGAKNLDIGARDFMHGNGGMSEAAMKTLPRDFAFTGGALGMGVGGGLGSGIGGAIGGTVPPATPDMTMGKAAAQAADGNMSPARSATGESKGLSFAHKNDDYAQGQAAWTATDKYFKGKKSKQPNPYRGDHQGKEASISPFAHGFISHCEELGLTNAQIKEAALKVNAEFPEAAAELNEALEKRAGIPGAGLKAVEGFGPKLLNWGKGLFGAGAKAAPGAAGAAEHAIPQAFGAGGQAAAPAATSLWRTTAKPGVARSVAQTAGGGVMGALADEDSLTGNRWGNAVLGAAAWNPQLRRFASRPGAAGLINIPQRMIQGNIMGQDIGQIGDVGADYAGMKGTNFQRLGGQLGGLAGGIGGTGRAMQVMGRGMPGVTQAAGTAFGAPYGKQVASPAAKWMMEQGGKMNQFGTAMQNPLGALMGRGGQQGAYYGPKVFGGLSNNAIRGGAMAGLGAGGLLGVHEGMQGVENRFANTARDFGDQYLNSRMPEIADQMKGHAQQFMQQHGMMNQQGQFNPFGGMMNGLSGHADNLIHGMGMDPSRMSGLQKTMLLGGMGLGGVGAGMGSPMMAGAGGLSALAGLMPTLMPGQGQPQMPNYGGNPQGGQGYQGYQPRMGGVNAPPPNMPQARNEWQAQQGG